MHKKKKKGNTTRLFTTLKNRIGDILAIFTVEQNFSSIHSKLYMISSSVDFEKKFLFRIKILSFLNTGLFLPMIALRSHFLFHFNVVLLFFY